jgi:dipeptidase
MIKAPEKMAKGYGSMMQFVDDAAFWVFNQVANFAYSRYNVIHPEIFNKQQALEQDFIAMTPSIDKTAVDLYNSNKDLAVRYLTEYSVNTGNSTVMEWKKFYGYLFTRFMDGNIKTEMPIPEGYIMANPKFEQPGYGEAWYRRIVNETGDHFKVIGATGN